CDADDRADLLVAEVRAGSRRGSYGVLLPERHPGLGADVRAAPDERQLEHSLAMGRGEDREERPLRLSLGGRELLEARALAEAAGRERGQDERDGPDEVHRAPAPWRGEQERDDARADDRAERRERLDPADHQA